MVAVALECNSRYDIIRKGDKILGTKIKKMEILQYYFEMFDSLFESEYGSEFTSSFETNINEYRERLKDTFDSEAVSYTQFCLIVDRYFDEYLESKR